MRLYTSILHNDASFDDTTGTATRGRNARLFISRPHKVRPSAAHACCSLNGLTRIFSLQIGQESSSLIVARSSHISCLDLLQVIKFGIDNIRDSYIAREQTI
jgi:hypothetical protein